MNLYAITELELAVRHVEGLIQLARPRGPLAEAPQKRRGHVSRTAKWLRKAIGNMIHDTPALMPSLGQYAIKPDITDAELDEVARKLEEARS